MDKEQRKKITSNITFLKERLGYLDPILDRLVEKNVLSIEQREQIDKVQPPTPHKKFNEFIPFLLSSAEPTTFPAFITALEEERYFNIVEKLQKDGPGRPKSQASRDSISRQSLASVVRPTTAAVHHQAASPDAPISAFPDRMSRSKTTLNRSFPIACEIESPDVDESIQQSLPPSPSPVNRSRYSTSQPERRGSGAALYTDRVTVAIGQMFAEFSGKITNDLLDGFERRRHEERVELELRMERKIEAVVDKRLDEKLTVFKNEWEKEKDVLLDRNESALATLQDSIDQLHTYQEDYNQLKTKYEQLQYTHSQMRDKENERWQRLSTLNKENTHFKNEGEQLKGHVTELKDRVQELESDNRALRDNEIQDQCRINQLTADKEDLLCELERTEKEKMDLKLRVDALSREIEKLISQQQERATKDDKAYQDALKKQNDRLDELYKVVQSLSDRDRQTRNLFVGGTTVSKAIRTANRPNK